MALNLITVIDVSDATDTEFVSAACKYVLFVTLHCKIITKSLHHIVLHGNIINLKEKL